MTVTQKTTPMMAQWHECKEVAGDAVLFFRMGDFYEAFYNDAVVLSKELELTLTKRQDIPMAGVPWHSSASYIDRLVAKGYRVAVAEQMEDPSQVKGLVRREVVRFVTPGTVVDSISEKSNNFFVSIAQLGSIYGLAVVDLTTAEFRVAEFESRDALATEMYRLKPAECLLSEKVKFEPHVYTNVWEEWHFDHEIAQRTLSKALNVHSLDGFGLKGMSAAVKAAGALFSYLNETLRFSTDHIRTITPYSTDAFLELNPTTQRTLELPDLRKILDETNTPMGGRLLKRWIEQPLLSSVDIQKRQDEVERLFKTPRTLVQLTDQLSGVRDLERLMMKIASNLANPRDLVALRYSLERLPAIVPLIERELEDLSDVASKIEAALTEEGAFNPGFNAELDELKTLSRGNKDWLAEYQVALREQTGIKTLKVGYNRVFGYYIEVSRGQSDRVPETFHRKQTLTNSERFIDPKLKEHETKVLTAEERLEALEQKLFQELREEVAGSSERILKVARTLAEVDCLASFATSARKRNYVRPIVDESGVLTIENGRHPTIDSSHFVPNDSKLDGTENQLLIITGPNMAGKSTYIRQVALITLMAQMGSFVPATAAHIGIVDKIFTRIGASDDLGSGQSTFMVEMNETANILNNATERSLVILDEIGRGTSTYDGVSIAWSVAEHLLTLKAKTLFATHYWELTELKGAVNYNVSVQDNDGDIVFLHKIVPGGADKSYGIHVARLAGIPLSVIERAQEILSHLEGGAIKTPPGKPTHVQLSLF